MAKLYETQSDLDKELELAAQLEKKWRCQLVKLPLAYKLDFAAVRNQRIVALLEFRRRHNPWDQYSTIMVSANKYIAANRYSRVFNVPAKFIVKYDDYLTMIDFSEVPDFFTIGGRTNPNNCRNDARDIEPVAHYNVGRLKEINLVDKAQE